jgi:hypothetical protein
MSTAPSPRCNLDPGPRRKPAGSTTFTKEEA